MNTHEKQQAICLDLLKTIVTSDLCFKILWKIIYHPRMFVPYAIALNVLFNLMICNELFNYGHYVTF